MHSPPTKNSNRVSTNANILKDVRGNDDPFTDLTVSSWILVLNRFRYTTNLGFPYVSRHSNRRGKRPYFFSFSPTHRMWHFKLGTLTALVTHRTYCDVSTDKKNFPESLLPPIDVGVAVRPTAVVCRSKPLQFTVAKTVK